MVYKVPVIGMAALHACKARVLHVHYTQCPRKCPKMCVITHIYKEFNTLLLRLKCFVWFLCSYRQLDAIIISALVSLKKLTWKLSSATHPVCSNIIAVTL